MEPGLRLCALSHYPATPRQHYSFSSGSARDSATWRQVREVSRAAQHVRAWSGPSVRRPVGGGLGTRNAPRRPAEPFARRKCLIPPRPPRLPWPRRGGAREPRHRPQAGPQARPRGWPRGWPRRRDDGNAVRRYQIDSAQRRVDGRYASLRRCRTVPPSGAGLTPPTSLTHFSPRVSPPKKRRRGGAGLGVGAIKPQDGHALPGCHAGRWPYPTPPQGVVGRAVGL